MNNISKEFKQTNGRSRTRRNGKGTNVAHRHKGQEFVENHDRHLSEGKRRTNDEDNYSICVLFFAS